jgi:hypothetical protein
MTRYVVIATVKRGRLLKFEPLDADGQDSARAAWRLDISAPLERIPWWRVFSEKDERKPVSAEKVRDVERMLDLARKTG